MTLWDACSKWLEFRYAVVLDMCAVLWSCIILITVLLSPRDKL